MWKSNDILRLLLKEHPKPASELNFKDNFQLLVSVMLSAQTTDKKVNQVTPSLFKLAKNYKELAALQTSDIEKIIRPLNYYKTKAKHLVEMGKLVVKEFHGNLPETIEEMTKLPGVGRKTASVVLSERGVLHTLPVDTHVFRVSRRLGLSNGKNPLSVEMDLRKLFAPKSWRTLHHLLILHGRRVCKAANPSCSECILNSKCPSRGSKSA